jgi:hypothetical protein
VKLSLNPVETKEGDTFARRKGPIVIQFTATRVFTIPTLLAPNAAKVDPVDCGCTDCVTGYSRPATDQEEYEIAMQAGVAR